jgi:hypothetical protein
MRQRGLIYIDIDGGDPRVVMSKHLRDRRQWQTGTMHPRRRAVT